MQSLAFLLLFVLSGATLCPRLIQSASLRPHANALDKIIQQLQEKVAKSQVKKGIPLDLPLKLYHQYGSYPSEILIYFHGNPPSTLLRNSIAFPDSNSFVTMWVSEILLEAARFSKGPVPSDEQLLAAVEAVSEYHDKNKPVGNPILVFWPQAYNLSTSSWECGPINLNAMAKDFETMYNYFEKTLDEIGLGGLAGQIAKLVNPVIELTSAFSIAPDFDDTFVNLGLGSLLKSYSTKSSRPYEAWLTNNTNVPEIMGALKKYAYRPFSSNRDANSIDPRTYFYMRDFLFDELRRGHLELALITTWVQNITEVEVDYYKNVHMPFNVNNVDLTVAANVIYGISAAVLNNMQSPVEWFDKDLQGIYNDSTNLIAWQIQRNFSSRPDLALTYYPSIYNFFWFISRTLNLLASSPSALPFPVMEDVLVTLKKAMRVHTTNILLKKAIVDNSSDHHYVYFEDFLGDGDTNIFGEPVKHHDDRICSTAMAVNTLFYSWSEKDQLLPDMPVDVQRIVTQASGWLIDHALSGKYKPRNAFFSGSVKSATEIPFFYPQNFAQFLNGSAIPKHYNVSEKDSDLIVTVSGIIPSATYQQLLTKTYFGYHVPIDFPGFNAPTTFSFPFWSSDTFTHSASLLALTQYRAFYNSFNRTSV